MLINLPEGIRAVNSQIIHPEVCAIWTRHALRGLEDSIGHAGIVHTPDIDDYDMSMRQKGLA